MGARIKAYDPIAMDASRQQRSDLKIRYCDSVREVAEEADALVVVTEWSEFGDIDLAALAPLMGKPVLVDGRNVFSPEAAAAGFDYCGAGRGLRQRSGDRHPQAVDKSLDGILELRGCTGRITLDELLQVHAKVPIPAEAHALVMSGPWGLPANPNNPVRLPNIRSENAVGRPVGGFHRITAGTGFRLKAITKANLVPRRTA